MTTYSPESDIRDLMTRLAATTPSPDEGKTVKQTGGADTDVYGRNVGNWPIVNGKARPHP